MITHVVLFELTPENDTAAVRQKARDVLLAMKGRVPSLQDIEVGLDELGSDRSFHISLITRHKDWDALAAYQEDPIHQEAAKYVRSVIQRAVSVDSASE